MITFTIEVPEAPTRNWEGNDEWIALAKDWPDGHMEYGRGKTQHEAVGHAIHDLMEYKGLPVQCAPGCPACIDEDGA